MRVLTQNSGTQRHVRIPFNASGDMKNLTKDQRDLLIILEDATLRFARDEIAELINMKEVRSSKLLKSYCLDADSVINSRIKQVRRVWGSEKAQMYEDALYYTVDKCEGALELLRLEVKTALVQKVEYQKIERAIHIATASGLIDSAQRIHTWLTGKKQTYNEARYALGIVDTKLSCNLLNAGRLPNMEESQAAFGRMFDTLCTAVLEKFTVKKNDHIN